MHLPRYISVRMYVYVCEYVKIYITKQFSRHTVYTVNQICMFGTLLSIGIHLIWIWEIRIGAKSILELVLSLSVGFPTELL